MYIKQITLEYSACREIINPQIESIDFIKSEIENMEIKNIYIDNQSGFIRIKIKDEKPIYLSDNYIPYFEKIFKFFKINSFEMSYDFINTYKSNDLQEISKYVDINKITDKHKKYTVSETIYNEFEININKTVQKIKCENEPVYKFEVSITYICEQNGEYIQLSDITKIDNLLKKVLTSY